MLVRPSGLQARVRPSGTDTLYCSSHRAPVLRAGITRPTRIRLHAGEIAVTGRQCQLAPQSSGLQSSHRRPALCIYAARMRLLWKAAAPWASFSSIPGGGWGRRRCAARRGAQAARAHPFASGIVRKDPPIENSKVLPFQVSAMVHCAAALVLSFPSTIRLF